MHKRSVVLLALPLLIAATLAAAPASSAQTSRPRITSISPSLGSTRARQQVTIHGHGFAHVRGVYVGHRKATAVSVLNRRTIVAYVPAQGAATRNVTVLTRAGTSRHVHADRYTYRHGDVTHTPLTPHLAPLPSDADVQDYDDEDLGNWSCGTPTHCVAVGRYETADATQHAMALVRDGRETSVSRVRGATALNNVSCVGPRFCAAIGEASDYAPALVILAHGNWTVQRLPNPDGTGTLPANSLAVGGLSCAAAGHCVFDGEDSKNGNGYIYTLSGTSSTGQPSLSVQPARGTAHRDVDFGPVSCPTTSWCVLVGSYAVKGSGERTIAITLQNGAAHVTLIFAAHNDTESGVTALDCPAVARCDGVGYYRDGDSGRLPAELAVLGAHGWQVLKVPDPADSHDPGTYLAGISCPVVAHCVGVGWYFAGRHGDRQDGLIVNLDGHTVREQNAPVPTSGSLARPELLDAVSCSTTTSCVAVGSVGAGALSETWTKAGVWVPARLGRPRGAVSDTEASYSTVTCPAGATCLVSGTTLYDYDEGEKMFLQPMYSIGVER